MREKYSSRNESITIQYIENKKNSVSRQVQLNDSFRVHKNGKVGVLYTTGNLTDEEGYRRAEENLVRERPYPFELETGVRHRDKTEQKLTGTELAEIAQDGMDYLLKTYPDFRYNVRFSQHDSSNAMTNEKGMDYSERDCDVTANVSFKHKDSRDIADGSFSFSLRKYDRTVFTRMADDYLANFRRMVDFPEEMIIGAQYYGVAGKLINELNGEQLALKLSLLTDKVGEKVFSDGLTFCHDVSDKEAWFSSFWDGDGCVFPDDRITFIDHGTVVMGIADKRDALKYNIRHTGPACQDYVDVPSTGGFKSRIERSGRTVKQLLDGRCSIVPVMAYGGGFNEKGDYTMPVHSSLLFDGDHIVGKLPPFTAVSNFFDMFGKDFIGVGTDQPIYNDKQMLYRIRRGELS